MTPDTRDGEEREGGRERGFVVKSQCAGADGGTGWALYGSAGRPEQVAGPLEQRRRGVFQDGDPGCGLSGQLSCSPAHIRIRRARRDMDAIVNWHAVSVRGAAGGPLVSSARAHASSHKHQAPSCCWRRTAKLALRPRPLNGFVRSSAPRHSATTQREGACSERGKLTRGHSRPHPRPYPHPRQHGADAAANATAAVW